jgi:hypothetical protein
LAMVAIVHLKSEFFVVERKANETKD